MKKRLREISFNTVFIVLLGLFFFANIFWKEANSFDLAVYGATPSGIIAAITAADKGAKVVLIEPTNVIGGMYSSGLNTAESEHMIDDAITGRARDFYIALGEKFYDSAYFQTFGNGRNLNFKEGDPAFFFESGHAQSLFSEMLDSSGIKLIKNRYIEEVRLDSSYITSIHLDSKKEINAKYFIDCSYEGDLMAMAGVSYTYGREPVDQYHEYLAGVRLIDDTLKARTVDEKGVLLPYFNVYDTLVAGKGDKRVMNYNFRPTMTKVKDNMRTVERPEDYDSSRFDFLADYLLANPETHVWDLIGIYKRGSGKYEFNNQQKAIISLGMFGANKGYTDGDRETREKIYNDHKSWTTGFLYFLGHDPRVPEILRNEMNEYGYARDEFIENDNFPVYLYVREGRRMIGEKIQTEQDIFRDRTKNESVMLGSHWVDSHHVQRIALSDSTFINEGRIWEIVLLPYEISYRVMTPVRNECTNLLVPVCASFSHVGFCSYRLESTWMQAGHVAGLATSLAMNKGKALQDIELEELQKMLKEEGMIIEASQILGYDDYAWLEGNERYKDSYKRMYDYYDVDIDQLMKLEK